MDHTVSQIDLVIYIRTEHASIEILSTLRTSFFSLYSLIFNIAMYLVIFFQQRLFEYINVYFIALVLVYLKRIILHFRPVRKIAKSYY
jgi:hypothetical protein